ncbi:MULTISPECIES: S8 family peptidase [Paenibacillus]|uniref:Alkaline serine protease n=1 Tax=Paenibacillus campinasensis TaxID=66347 RepID=A0A268EQ82_9BACL|nr:MULTISPECIES: S8 family peptidase [Paenibacillus]PAD75289.1 alkaline serine protease [Paenibacillus campinasensis]PAK55812.1 alkaline serine protease [Paenibacillus sp. 7541]
MWLWIGVSAAALIVLGFLLYRLYSQHADRQFPPHVAHELVVRFAEGITQEQIDAIHKKARCEVVETSEDLGYTRIKSKRSMRRILKHYSKLKEIEYAEPNILFNAFYTPNDPYFAFYQYGPQKIEAPAAWDVTQSSPDVVIAVLDTGVQLDHPELAPKLVSGYDFVDGDAAPYDGNGHGTHVAGIVAAATNNARGIAGVAPLASIMPVRVLDNSGSGNLSSVASGIIYAVNQGARVINLSLGSRSAAQTLQHAIQYAWDRGVVVIAAAGNENTNAPAYPAYYPNVIAVASTNQRDARSSFSNYGNWVDVAAPGDQILSTHLRGNYAYLSGTSMAAPHVAGVAGLLAAQQRTHLQIHNAIVETADPIPGTGTLWRHGRVNAARAVQMPIS